MKRNARRDAKGQEEGMFFVGRQKKIEAKKKGDGWREKES